jgi:hypothetical protein
MATAKAKWFLLVFVAGSRGFQGARELPRAVLAISILPSEVANRDFPDRRPNDLVLIPSAFSPMFPNRLAECRKAPSGRRKARNPAPAFTVAPLNSSLGWKE